jgi:hypothetical protein
VKKKILLILALVFVTSLFPFSTTLVPEWKLRVVDETGAPYVGKGVREFCDSYTLNISPCQEAGDLMRVTDNDGYVVFPERRIRASLLSRIVRTILSLVTLLPHGAIGSQVYVDATGPRGYETLKYAPDKPLPTEFILKSGSADN